MSLNKITHFSKPVSALADRPRMTAADLKAWFDSNSTNEVKTAINDLIDALVSVNGASEIGVNITGVAEQTVYGVLRLLKTMVDDCYTIEQSDERFSLKFDSSNAQDLVKTVNLDVNTGVLTVTKYDGTSQTWDTALEKVALDAKLDGTDFVLTLADGTEQRVPLSAFVDTYNFISSDTVAADITENEDSKDIQFTVRDGSITREKLNVTFLNEIIGYVNSAKTSETNAAASESSAAESAEKAAKSASDAAKSALSASNSESTSAAHVTDSKTYADNSEASALRAEAAAKKLENVVSGEIVYKDDIVDDLTTGGSEKVASAETVKTINTNLSSLSQTVTANKTSTDAELVSINTLVAAKSSKQKVKDLVIETSAWSRSPSTGLFNAQVDDADVLNTTRIDVVLDEFTLYSGRADVLLPITKSGNGYFRMCATEAPSDFLTGVYYIVEVE